MRYACVHTYPFIHVPCCIRMFVKCIDNEFVNINISIMNIGFVKCFCNILVDICYHNNTAMIVSKLNLKSFEIPKHFITFPFFHLIIIDFRFIFILTWSLQLVGAASTPPWCVRPPHAMRWQVVLETGQVPDRPSRAKGIDTIAKYQIRRSETKGGGVDRAVVTWRSTSFQWWLTHGWWCMMMDSIILVDISSVLMVN